MVGGVRGRAVGGGQGSVRAWGVPEVGLVSLQGEPVQPALTPCTGLQTRSASPTSGPRPLTSGSGPGAPRPRADDQPGCLKGSRGFGEEPGRRHAKPNPSKGRELTSL